MPFYIGDIHGCLDQLKSVYRQIRVYASQNNVNLKKHPIVCVGDYIDRGPDSAGVVRFIIERQATDDFKWICLKGNHEDMLLFEDPSGFAINGGMQTLASYNTFDREKIFEEHGDWYRSLPLWYVDGDVACAHAGILENLAVEDNSEEYLLWSRDIRMHAHEIYRYTVHGHTPMKNVLYNESVAYIDTGAVFGGHLSCLFIPDTINVNTNEFVFFRS